MSNGLDIKNLDKISLTTLDEVLRRLLCNKFWQMLSDEEKSEARKEYLSKSFYRGAYWDASEYAYNLWRAHPLRDSEKMKALDKLWDTCQNAIWDYEGVTGEEE